MSNSLIRNFVRAVSTGSLAAMFLAAGSAHAQAFFEPLATPNSQSTTLAAGNTPQGVAVADFNHDGFPDMVVANQAANTIDVYLSTGPGTFAAPVTYPTGGGPTAVLAADLDNTGLQDIVITCKNPTANVIEVFLNLGNGTFNPVVDGITNIVLGTGATPVAITMGDFNDDGHPDLATADMGGGTVTLFLSDASTNYTSYLVRSVSVPGAPAGITAGRFDTTGNTDLAVTDFSNDNVNILIGDGRGDFTVGTPVAVGSKPTGIVAGDWNHDGFLDLAAINSGTGIISILLGQGNDKFTVSSTASVSNAPTLGNSILAFDVDGDGNPDLLTANPKQSGVTVLISNGNGSFENPSYIPVPSGPAYLVAADFSRTGKPDLAVTQQNGASVSLLVNNTLPTPVPGGRSFNPPYVVSTGYGNMADSITTADFTGDGKADIAVAYLEDNAVRVMIADGNGYFQPAKMYAVGKQPYDVVSGDLNNDGYPDLVTANTADGTVSVLVNNGDGTGTFPAAQTYSVGKLPFQVAIGDLNGDGIPDLAVTNYGDNTVSVLWGKLSGSALSYVAGPVLPTGTNPYGVAIADFHHNGMNDIAVTCFGTSQLYVFQNNGGGTFQSPAIYSTDSKPTSIAIGDFNRDGNLDIVTGNSTANDVSFFAGMGDGTFKPAVNSFALNFPDSIAAGDINGDGILDIVAVAPNFNMATVLLGKGDGTFLPRFDFATGPQPWAVTLADTNHDGKLDILTANTYNRVNLTIPAYQTTYMQKFPPTKAGNPSINRLFNASGSELSLTVSPTGTVPYNSSVTLTAKIAPNVGTTSPTGSIIFEDGPSGTVLGSGPVPVSGGTATLTVPPMSSGRHLITLLYSGDTLYQPLTAAGNRYAFNVSTAPVTVPVTLTVTPTTVPAGGNVSYTVVVGTPGGKTNPTGTVSLYGIAPGNTGTYIFDTRTLVSNKNGTATASNTLVNVLPPGTWTLFAVYMATGSTQGVDSNQVPVAFQ